MSENIDAAIRMLHNIGSSHLEITKQLKISRNQVRRVLSPASLVAQSQRQAAKWKEERKSLQPGKAQLCPGCTEFYGYKVMVSVEPCPACMGRIYAASQAAIKARLAEVRQ